MSETRQEPKRRSEHPTPSVMRRSQRASSKVTTGSNISATWHDWVLGVLHALPGLVFWGLRTAAGKLVESECFLNEIVNTAYFQEFEMIILQVQPAKRIKIICFGTHSLSQRKGVGTTWHINLKGQVCSTERYASFPTNYSYSTERYASFPANYSYPIPFHNSHNKTHIQLHMKLHAI